MIFWNANFFSVNSSINSSEVVETFNILNFIRRGRPSVAQVFSKLKRFPAELRSHPKLLEICVEERRMDLLKMLNTRYMSLFYGF